MWVPSLGQEDPLEKGMATHSSILAWRIPWTEEPGRLQSMRLAKNQTQLKQHHTAHFKIQCGHLGNNSYNRETLICGLRFLYAYSVFFLLKRNKIFLSSVQLFSCDRLFATPWTTACPASLSITNSRSLLKLISIAGEGNVNPLQYSCLENPRDRGAWWAGVYGVVQSQTRLKQLSSSSSSMSIEPVMPSNHLILCHPLLLLPSIPPIIRIFSNESVLCLKWRKYWSFSFNISPSNEYSGLISFRMDWLDLLGVQGLSRVFSNTTVQKHQFFSAQLSLQYNSHPYMTRLEKPEL